MTPYKWNHITVPEVTYLLNLLHSAHCYFPVILLYKWKCIEKKEKKKNPSINCFQEI